MSLLSCLRCATKFAVGLLHCPHCLSEDFEEDGVGKITVAGGASLPDKTPSVPPAPEAPAAEVVTEPPAPESEPFVLKADLQDQARELGLPVSGTKAELADAVAAATEAEPAQKAAPSLSGPAKSG
jgi:hypothetical protein